MTLSAPLFIEDGAVTTSITVVSLVNQAVAITVSGYEPGGASLGSSAIPLEPHGEREIKIADLLRTWKSGARTGSIRITQDAKVEGLAVEAHLSINGTANGRAVRLVEVFERPAAGRLQAVASGVAGNPAIALWNIGTAAQTVTVRCLAETGVGGSAETTLEAGRMAVVAACGGEMPAAAGAIFSASGGGAGQAFGVSISGSGAPGSLAAYGIAQRGGRPVAMTFRDAAEQRSGDSIFTGVPVGATGLVPGSSFAPEIAVANFGGGAANVSVTYASGTAAAAAVARVSVPAGSSRTLRLPALGGDPELRNSFVVASDAPAGAIATAMTSDGGAAAGPLVSWAGTDPKRDTNGGAGRWSVANGDATTLALFNPANAPAQASVHISAMGVLWAKSYTLAPMETRAVNVGELIANGEMDIRGRRIPTDATEGEIAWFTPNSGEGMGRLAVTNAAAATFASPDYQIYFVLCSVALDPYVLSFDWEDTADYGPLIPEFCTAISAYACSGTASGPGAASYSWASLNQSVATISGPTTNASAQVYGAGPGQAPMECQVDTKTCSFQAKCSASVKVPATLWVSITGEPAGKLTTTIPLQGGSATLNAYVTIGPGAGALKDRFSVAWGFEPPVSQPSEILSTHHGDMNSSGTYGQGNTSPIQFFVGTASGNAQSGYLQIFAGASASDTSNPSVQVDFGSSAGQKVIVNVANH